MDKKTYINRESKKSFYYLYSWLIEKPEDYDCLTRGIMCDEIEKALQNNYSLILELLTEEELDQLANFLKNSEYKIDFKCWIPFVSTNREYKYDIYDGFRPYLEKAILDYENHKDEIIKMKQKLYYAQGLVYTFGALSIKDFLHLFNKEYPNYDSKSFKEILTSPYIRKNSVCNRNSIYIPNLRLVKKEILETHNFPIQLKDTAETIITRGHYIIDINNPLFIKIKQNRKLEYYVINYRFIDLICYAGFNDVKGYLDLLPIYYTDESDYSPETKDLIMFDEYFKALPKFLLGGNTTLTTEEAYFFYKTFMPFICWYGKKKGYHLMNEYNKVNQKLIVDVIDIASKEHFALADEYVKNNSLNQSEKEFVLGLKKAKNSIFCIREITKDGALFIDENSKCYLVKGLNSSFREVFPCELPVFIKTMILPFKDKITYDSVINYLPFKINKTLNDIIENIDAKNIITSLK